MKKLIALAVAVILSGCANMSDIKAPSSTFSALQGAKLTVVTYKTPDFSAMTYGKTAAGAMFGAVGGVVAAESELSEGNRIIRDNGVVDPAQSIAKEISPILADKLKASGVAELSDSASDSESVIAKASGGSGVILDVETINWMFVYEAFHWSNYHVLYNGRARLIDASTAKVIAQIPCKYDSDDNGGISPTYDQLVDAKAALLKEKLASATSMCMAAIQKSLFE